MIIGLCGEVGGWGGGEKQRSSEIQQPFERTAIPCSFDLIYPHTLAIHCFGWHDSFVILSYNISPQGQHTRQKQTNKTKIDGSHAHLRSCINCASCARQTTKEASSQLTRSHVLYTNGWLPRRVHANTTSVTARVTFFFFLFVHHRFHLSWLGME